MSLTWNGDALIRKMNNAAKFGIDLTMSKAIIEAKEQYYPGHGLILAVLQGSIRMQPAEIRGPIVIGSWGSFSVAYAIHVEQGTGTRPGQGQLRGAADHQYPLLAGRIAAEMARA